MERRAPALRTGSSLFVFCCALTVPAQEPWTIGMRGGYGFMAPHHHSLWYIVESHALTGELFVEHPFSGKKDWHHWYMGPRWGIGMLYTDAGSPHFIGSAVRIAPYLDLPLYRQEHFLLSMRIGWGFGWIADPFDRLEHHKQSAIGSHVNGGVIIGFEAQRELGRVTAGAGLSLDHWSNGAFQIPNLGINVVTANLSARVRIGDRPAELVAPDTASLFVPHNDAIVMAAMGWQQVYPIGSGRHPVYSVSGSMHRRITRKSSIGGGVDLFNKEALTILDPELADQSRASLTQFGIHVGYALWMGDLSLIIDNGIYLVTPYEEKSSMYQRIGMRHRIGRRFFANLTLKTHFGTADHLEIGLGYHVK